MALCEAQTNALQMVSSNQALVHIDYLNFNMALDTYSQGHHFKKKHLGSFCLAFFKKKEQLLNWIYFFTDLK